MQTDRTIRHAHVSVRARVVAVAAAALLAMVVVAGPAHTSPPNQYEDGSVSCNMSAPVSWVQFTATGPGKVSPPGIVGFELFGHLGWETSHRSGALYGGTWWVEAVMGVSSVGTFGYCSL